MLTRAGIEQILGVIDRVKLSGRSVETAYPRAVSEVAREAGVTYQTIGDACRRRLALKNITEFKDLVCSFVEDSNAEPLRNCLRRSSQRAARPVIDRYFRESLKSGSQSGLSPTKPPLDFEPLTLQLSRRDARLLRAVAELEGIPSDDLAVKLVAEAARTKMRTLAGSFT